MKQVILVVLCCSLLGTTHIVPARELTTREQKIIMDVIDAKLRDPVDAKYFWQDYKEGDVYCAHVNSKLPYGGYGGKTPIILELKRDENGQIKRAKGVVSNDSLLLMKFCTEAGYKT
ncbi:hypothetical protein XK97_20935 [Obesumbacterium proteus]|uniref:hypothetical protein n=1 Tax=Obesumbacterium proteus TaxID=82983 RepID=UPI00062147E3|nr:hypothetical protein [Obesumbacterium proteus]KKI41257.1 hypothetical protein XK97_20935 [Obesumbacterium proteus]